ncbi:MAG: DUF2812 domain-containing protein [Huintestinicola sp.]
MTKYMPFWFADIIKTEEKLGEYAAKGLILRDFKPVSGEFIFEESSPAKKKYRICRQSRCNGKMPRKLSELGWERVCGCKNYYVAAADRSADIPSPSYSAWTSLYRVLKVILALPILYFAGFICGAGVGSAASGKHTASDMIYMLLPSVIILIALAAALIYLFRSGKKIKDTDPKKTVELSFTIPKENLLYSKEEEKQLIKSGKMIKKLRLGWYYAPDKAEKYVCEMAEQGWRFYRFDKLGTIFYFVRSEPCRMRFVLDYQLEATDEYFQLNKDGGWKLEFTSFTRITSFCVWTMTYDAESEPPEFYSDHESKLRHARSMMLSMAIPFPICAAILINCIAGLINDGLEHTLIDVIFIIICLPLIAEYTIWTAVSVGYYIRLHRNEIDK